MKIDGNFIFILIKLPTMLFKFLFQYGSDHLRRPSSSAACLKDVPGTFFSRQNSTWDLYGKRKH